MIQITEAFKRSYSRLNAEQKKAVDHIEGPVMVVAGPGTGKTEILTNRIGNILLKTDADPDNILCLTYTDTAAVEMRKRLIKYIGPLAHRVHIQTFHAFCNGVLLENPDEFGIHGLELASDIDKIEILHEIIDQLEWKNPLKRGIRDMYYLANQLKGLFEDVKKEGWQPELLAEKTKEEIEKNDFTPDKIRRKERFIAAMDLFATYAEMMVDRKRYDFDDMILWVIDAFKEKEELLLNYQEQFQYILVDEFQDTSGSQFEILDLLCNYWDNPNLFVVGDDDQSIFRFQGANIENIVKFHEKYKEHIELIVLKENYRSSQGILNLCKDLIGSNLQRLGSTLSGIDFDKNLHAANQRVADSKSIPKTVVCKNPQQEAIYVVKQIEEIIENGQTPLSEISVLYSKNKQIGEIRKLLEKKQIPYQISQSANILESKIVESMILIGTYISRERKQPFKNDHLLFQILHLPYFNISPIIIAELQYKLRFTKLKTRYSSLRQVIMNASLFSGNDLFSSKNNINYDNIGRLSKNIESWIQLVDNDILARVFETILSSGILSYIIQNDKKIEMLEDVESFFIFIQNECKKSPFITLDQLITKIELLKKIRLKVQRNISIGSTEGVVLSTVHSAKGKEFENVFMIGCIKSNWDTSPRGYAFSFPENLFRKNESSDIEEKRRLFYVGLSRAKQHLILTYPEKKDEIVDSVPSIFYTQSDISMHSSSDEIALSSEEQLPYVLTKYTNSAGPTVSLLDSSLIKDRVESYSLSVSHLNKYLECPLKFYYEHIIGVPAIENAAMVFGSVIHYSLEMYFKNIKNGQFPTKELLIHFFEEEMTRRKSAFHEKEFNSRHEHGVAILSQYYDERRVKWNPNVEVEKKFKNILFDDCLINGMVDKIELDGQHAVLIDYKTGNYQNDLKKYKNFNRPGEGRKVKTSKSHVFEYGGNYWRQAVFYKILLMQDPKVSWHLDKVEFEFIEADKYGKIPKPHAIFVSDDDLFKVKDQIKTVFHKIKKYEFNTGCGEKDCKWCNYATENLSQIEETVLDPSMN